MVVQLSRIVLPLDFITMGVCYISHVDRLYIYKQPPLPVKNTCNILFTVHCFSHKSRDSQNNNYENEHWRRNSRKMKYLQYLKVLLAVVTVWSLCAGGSVATTLIPASHSFPEAATWWDIGAQGTLCERGITQLHPQDPPSSAAFASHHPCLFIHSTNSVSSSLETPPSPCCQRLGDKRHRLLFKGPFLQRSTEANREMVGFWLSMAKTEKCLSVWTVLASIPDVLASCCWNKTSGIRSLQEESWFCCCCLWCWGEHKAWTSYCHEVFYPQHQ